MHALQPRNCSQSWWQQQLGVLTSLVPRPSFPLPLEGLGTRLGASRKGKRIQFNYDNMAVVSVLSSGYCKEKSMAHMLRCLFFLEAWHDFSIIARHVLGKENRSADALSCNELSIFLQLTPSALPAPTPIPHRVVEGLLSLQGWTVARWIKWSNLFDSITGSIYTEDL